MRRTGDSRPADGGKRREARGADSVQFETVIGRGVLHRVARSSVGSRALTSILRADPNLAIEAIGPLYNRRPRFSNVDLPGEIHGFEDVSFLFSSNALNWGITGLALDEAAFLWQLTRSVGSASIAEIGRYKGGGTFLLAAATAPGSKVYSYDLRVKLAGEFDFEEIDRELRAALDRYKLGDRVEIIVGNSRTVDLPPDPCSLVFIDGDHSYEGVRADYEHWRRAVAPEGHLLFHDAVPQPLRGHHAEVEQLVSEVERADFEFERRPGAGSIAHFVRR